MQAALNWLMAHLDKCKIYIEAFMSMVYWIVSLVGYGYSKIIYRLMHPDTTQNIC